MRLQCCFVKVKETLWVSQWFKFTNKQRQVIIRPAYLQIKHLACQYRLNLAPTSFKAVVGWPPIIKLGTVQQVVSLQEADNRADKSCCHHHIHRDRLPSGQQGINKRPIEEIADIIQQMKREGENAALHPCWVHIKIIFHTQAEVRPPLIQHVSFDKSGAIMAGHQNIPCIVFSHEIITAGNLLFVFQAPFSMYPEN